MNRITWTLLDIIGCVVMVIAVYSGISFVLSPDTDSTTSPQATAHEESLEFDTNITKILDLPIAQKEKEDWGRYAKKYNAVCHTLANMEENRKVSVPTLQKLSADARECIQLQEKLLESTLSKTNDTSTMKELQLINANMVNNLIRIELFARHLIEKSQ